MESRRNMTPGNFKIVMLNLCTVNMSLFQVCFKLFTCTKLTDWNKNIYKIESLLGSWLMYDDLTDVI